jgi:probable HAF family extracellular repeat protein
MHDVRGRSLVMVALIVLIWSQTASPQTYQMTNLGDFLPVALNAEGVMAGSVGSSLRLLDNGVFEGLPDPVGLGRVESVSDRHEAVGQVVHLNPGPGPNVVVPAYWFHGQLFELSTISPNANSEATAISPTTGIIVGFGDFGSLQAGFEVRAWRQFPDGTLEVLDTLGGDHGSATGVNDDGEVVGNATTATGATLATRWEIDGSPTVLGHLGGGISSATAINADGVAVGFSTTSMNQVRAFRTTGASLVQLQGLPAPFLFCSARAITTAQEVVGSCSYDVDQFNEVRHAVRWSASAQVLDLNTQVIDLPSGCVLEEAVAINESGQIAGISRCSGVRQGFLLTPIRDAAAPRQGPRRLDLQNPAGAGGGNRPHP